jgi:hypothetical protein
MTEERIFAAADAQKLRLEARLNKTLVSEKK